MEWAIHQAWLGATGVRRLAAPGSGARSAGGVGSEEAGAAMVEAPPASTPAVRQLGGRVLVMEASSPRVEESCA